MDIFPITEHVEACALSLGKIFCDDLILIKTDLIKK